MHQKQKKIYDLFFWIKEAKNPFFPDFIAFLGGPKKSEKRPKNIDFSPRKLRSKNRFL